MKIVHFADVHASEQRSQEFDVMLKSFVEDVKKRYPRVITFLVKRREGRYNDKKNRHCDFEVKNLKEAAKLIEKLEKSNKSEEGLCAE